MKTFAKVAGASTIFLALVSGVAFALPNNAYEIEYYDAAGDMVGYDSYYCGRNHGGLDWGYMTDNVVYRDLGWCNDYNSGK
ncbi:MAG: hypothetical protein M3Y70_04315 [Pseudomonadota bacterium]|nr:hypothetical protein [Pseudomonadota bacterium]